MRERALETKILRLINRANREYHLINPGDRILVALSGGKDSYSMMWALTKIRAATNFFFRFGCLPPRPRPTQLRWFAHAPLHGDA